MPEANRKTGNTDRQGQPHIRPAHAREVPQQPEHDTARLFGIGGFGNDEGRHGIEQLRTGHTGQDDGTVAVPCTHRQKTDKRECDEGTDQCPRRHCQKARPKAEKGHAHRSGGGARGNTEDIGVGKRVAQQRLQNRAGKRQ